jgi:cytochrome c5
MSRYILLFFSVLILFGCGKQDAVEPAPVESVTEGITSSPSAYQIGQQAYEEFCARCHAEGLDAAPKVGDRAAWNNRSAQWEAVLFEHARNGFGEMPAKGGEAMLDEATVSKAAEYMMSLTYPEMPRG